MALPLLSCYFSAEGTEILPRAKVMAKAEFSLAPLAMQVPYDYITGSIRFSFSRFNQPEDVKIIVERIKQIRGLG